MTSSIRRRALFIILPLVTGIWLLSAYISYYNTKQTVSSFLDTQLAQNGQALLAMSMHELVEQLLLSETKNPIAETVETSLWQDGYPQENQIAFQVWLHNKTLTLRSKNAPETQMSSIKKGFDTVSIFGNPWRVYTVSTTDKIINIQVAMQISAHNSIAKSITERVITPLVFLLPILAFFIWYGVNLTLLPIKQISIDLNQRKTSDLSPIDELRAPKEARPLTAAVNRLFSQLKTAFDTEKRFTSDAAHELRTPLAALKTHAEIALQAKDTAEQQKALRHVVQGVNRATRLVEQLLTLARLDPDTGFTNIRRVDLFIAAESVLSNEAHLAIDKNIEIGLGGTRGKFVAANYDAICVLMRNLVDNAIRYTPRDGEVEVNIDRRDNIIILSIADSGPGIPEEERSKIFNRFYRSLGTKESGSGLGLSIVTRIADLHHLNISLGTSRLGGLQIDIEFTAKDYEGTSEPVE
ncbi:MAG: ATP-binding protein [Gammaproteobacteria bacterium]|nr:ATP-binding protein [Gammaproteobacteria bacterium]